MNVSYQTPSALAVTHRSRSSLATARMGGSIGEVLPLTKDRREITLGYYCCVSFGK